MAVEEERVEEVAERIAANPLIIRHGESIALAVTVEAATLREARDEALRVAQENMRAVGLPDEVSDVRLQTMEEVVANIPCRWLPKAVGYADIAKMFGVSEQQVRAIASHPEFPRYG